MQKKKFDIVCLSFPAWDGNYVKSTVKLMSALSHSQRVIFVDYAYTWKDVIRGILGKHAYIPWKRVLGLQNRVRQVVVPQGTVEVFSLPPVIPVNWTRSPFLLKRLIQLNGGLLQRVLTRGLKKRAVVDPVVVNALNPVYGNALAGRLEEKLLVYYCYDEIQAGRWMTVHGHAAEEDFLKKVDLVITSSEKLRERKLAYHPKCYTVNNGVDLDIFMLGATPEQSFSTSPNKPVIGYLGSVDHRIDIALIDKLLGKFPQVELQFVGRVTSEEVVEHYKGHPQVHFQGPKTPDKLAHFLGKFDVGIIPFVKNEFTEGIYPMKINEYLAAGLSVVSTRFGDMNSFESVATICDTHEEFLESIGKVLNTDSNSVDRMERIHFAQQNTWDRRAVEFLKIIKEGWNEMYGKGELLREGLNIRS